MKKLKQVSIKKAFTMVELIFIIIIIGILSGVAVPRLMATRDDALIVKNMEYIVASMTEISTYIVAKGSSTNDLTEMSDILQSLQHQGRLVIDIAEKSTQIKIGEDVNCITIDVDSNGTTELLSTKFSVATSDRVCNMVQLAIQEQDYPLILRGRLIRF